jgi:hypothetical protein
MIDAKRNRLDYGKQLAPPMGYELDHAIGTTYSLDLEAILLIPVALFFAEDLDINPKEVRDDTLEALVEVSKKVSIYHQRGKIKVPEHYSQLMAYWEKGLCPVHLDHFARSFHPKIWIIRYTEINGNNVIYRIINTSRNLTFSRDWDLAITTEGKVEKDTVDQNQPLLDFINYLNQFKKVPKQIFKELASVKFESINGFDEIVFHPIGIDDKGENEYVNPITSDKYKKDFRLIMSPFIDQPTLELLSDNCNETVLFSSEYELSKIPTETLEKIDRKFMFSPFIEDAEHSMELSETGMIPMHQNLHAKFYIIQRGGQRSWYIGSANATSPANERNIEFLVELKGGKYKYRPQVIEDELINLNEDGISLFKKFHDKTNEEVIEEQLRQQKIRKLIYELSSIRFSADVLTNNIGTYDLMISIPGSDIEIPEDLSVKIKPLPEKSIQSQPISLNVNQEISEFKGYQEIDLSPFLIVEIWSKNDLEKKFVVDMAIDLDRFTNRMNRIFSNIISNKSRFLSYLSFLLSDNAPTIISDENDENSKKSSSNHNGIAYFEGTPIYEKLLVAASRNPKKLNKINSLIDRIREQRDQDDQPIVSDDFDAMWEIFKPFLK